MSARQRYLDALGITTVEDADGTRYYVTDTRTGEWLSDPYPTRSLADAEIARQYTVMLHRRQSWDRGSDAMGHRLPGHFESRG